jgi:putative transcriptional regulator
MPARLALPTRYGNDDSQLKRVRTRIKKTAGRSPPLKVLRELREEDFARALPRRQRERIMRGEIEPATDVAALRRFAGLTQQEFAEALGISVHTLRNWEQGRRRPEGPALALLRVAARHPRVLRENLAASA